jgi:hypothetical protein
MTSMTRLLLVSLFIFQIALAADPAFVALTAARPGDWSHQQATIASRKPYGNFRLSFRFAGPGSVQLGSARFPFAGAGQAQLTADGLGVQFSVNGRSRRLSRPVRTGPVTLLAAGEAVRVEQLEIAELAPGPALGEDLSALVPDFRQRTGPNGLFLLFVRSVDW